jgi:DNA mismatch repair protein MutL
MGRIQVLDPATAAPIAAGEVITRPAAVVKELIENALDAGAASLTIRVEEGGRRRIWVADDGSGMTAEDAPLSVLRHATSKIRREEDLLGVATLGFRGEALASMAAVARLTIITRAAGEGAGVRVVAQGGDVVEIAPAASPFGTQVVVEELFYNTPARRKFLRGKDAEQAAVVEVVRQLALAYPEVHFELSTPERTLLSAPAAATLTERVAALFGPELARHLMPFELAAGPLGVAGVLSEPDFSVATSRLQTFLVNRRVVQDRILGAVLKEVYQGRLLKGRHPAAVVSLRLPPELVDVNVHPAKAEVRFRDAGRVYGLLVTALRQGLGPLVGTAPHYQVAWHAAPLPLAAEPQTMVGGEPGSAPRIPFQTAVPSGIPPARFSSLGCRFQDLAVLGQLQHTYVLAQGPEGLVIIDQHAAHERVLYERLQEKSARPVRQPLLFPKVVEVSPSQAEWLRENLAVLAAAGLELEPFGGAGFLLTGAPPCLEHRDLEAVVLETVEALSPLKSGADPQAVQEQARIIMACRGAIKAGQELSREEMVNLLMQLDEAGGPSHCPHGRPLWRLLPMAELHVSFRRPKK